MLGRKARKKHNANNHMAVAATAAATTADELNNAVDHNACFDYTHYCANALFYMVHTE